MDDYDVFGSDKSAHRKSGLNRRSLLSSLAMLPMLSVLPGQKAAAQQASSGFSFAVYGDSRPMMYLPYKEGQPELN